MSTEPTTSAPAPPAPKWTGAEVSEYLARWGIEEAVQEAVNSAISHKAADPVLHVAKILEEKGRAAEAARRAESGADEAPS